MHMSCHRVARQNGLDPPEHFRIPSINTHIAHHLSGPTAASIPSRKTILPSSPWSVFQDGREHPPFTPFTFISHHPPFHTSITLLIRYRSSAIFSLRCIHHRIRAALPSNTTHKKSRRAYRHIALSASEFNRTRRCCHKHNPPNAVTTQAHAISLAATQAIPFGFFSSLY